MSVGVRTLSLPTGIALTALAAAPLIGWALAGEHWPILALLALVGAVPVVIRWPVISTFGLYAFLVPFDSVAGLGGGATLTRLVGMAAAAALLGAALIERRLVRPPPAALWCALFMLWAILTLAWAVIDLGPFLRGLQTPLSLVLLYFVAVSMRVSEKELAWVCAFTVLGAALAAGLSIFTGVEPEHSESGRRAVMLGDQMAGLNRFGTTLLLPLALASGGFIRLRRWTGRLLALAAVGVLSAAIYLTMSRGALVALAATTMVLLYRFRVRWQVLLVACLLIGVAATMPQAFVDRIVALAEDDATGTGRIYIWAIGLEALERHGVVGAGFRSFMEVYGQTVPIAPSSGPRGAHNSYLEAWVEVGIVGLVLLLAALACHIWAAHRAGRGTGAPTSRIAVPAIEAACYGILVASFFGDYLWTKFFWLPWTLLAWAVQDRGGQAPAPGVARAQLAPSERAD